MQNSCKPEGSACLSGRQGLAFNIAKAMRKNLVFALIAISTGGLLLHLRIHPPVIEGALEWERLIPAVVGALSIIVIPCLFLRENTADLAYLLTGISVILGIITMSHISIAAWQEGAVSPGKILFKTTLPDSLILSAKFFIAKTIFESYFPERVKLNCQYPQAFRFLFDGWWAVHFIAIAAVYALGVILF